MAEARLAVGLQIQVTEEGFHLHFDSDAFKFVLRALARSAKRRIKDVKNAILKRSFPATPASWFVLVAALSAARYSEHQATLGVLGKLEQGFPGAHNLNPNTVIALAVLFVATILWLLIGKIYQFTLRQLLKYRSFLYEPRGHISSKTKCWWTLVKLFGGKNPSLYSYEKSMPYLPVPDLDQTVQKYLESVKHLMDDEKYQKVEKMAKEFKETGVGSRLQRYLVLKSWWSNNYVTEWWEQYVYLRSRSPIMINSNYYGVDSVNHPTKIQSARAGNIIHSLFYYRKLISKEKLEPQFALGIVPVCSEQFRRTFNTTRIPGKEQDKLMSFPEYNHCVVYHKGRFFKLDCYFRGQSLKPADIERQIEKILHNTTEPLPGELLLPSLTAANRTLWAETRETYFGEGVNKKSLDIIEKAAFFLILDDKEMDYSECNSDDLDKFGRHAIHGNGHNIWFDKSFNIIVYSNGRIGFNCEHSWADAPICSHMAEIIVTDDANYLGYKEDGHCKGEPQYKSMPSPMKLEWDIPTKCINTMEICERKNVEMISDLELHIEVFNTFGKGVIKKCKVSPDAFIQMAMQLAYFKDQGRFDLTYESSMTRLFRDGRTETVRACTNESCIFARGMMDPEMPKDKKRELFVKATDRHVFGFRQAMEGKGIDRHLFCLYVVSKYLETDSPFLNEALSGSWKLSTSQTPTNQTKRLDLKKNPELLTAGGGFGPVVDDGYGISYIIGGENTLFFHISCKDSASNTDAKRLGRFIAESLVEIQELFE